MKKGTIVLTGGGTAGHVTVNINLQNELKKHFNKIIYIGSKNGIEKELIKKNTNYEYYEITTVKFERKKLFKNLLIPCKLSKGIKEAKELSYYDSLSDSAYLRAKEDYLIGINFSRLLSI